MNRMHLPRHRPGLAPAWRRRLVRMVHRASLRSRIQQLVQMGLQARASRSMPAEELALLEARIAELRCELYALEQLR